MDSTPRHLAASDPTKKQTSPRKNAPTRITTENTRKNTAAAESERPRRLQRPIKHQKSIFVPRAALANLYQDPREKHGDNTKNGKDAGALDTASVSQ